MKRVLLVPVFVLLAVLTLLGVGGLAGLIPAGFLASWRPLDVVSGRVRRKLPDHDQMAAIARATTTA